MSLDEGDRRGLRRADRAEDSTVVGIVAAEAGIV